MMILIELGPVEPLPLADGEPDAPGLEAARIFGPTPRSRADHCPYPAKGDDGSSAACIARRHCHCFLGKAAA